MTSLLLILFVLNTINGNGQRSKFEGSLFFTKQTKSDTNYYAYHIKDNLVRIDEYDNNEVLKRYIVINIEEKSITYFIPSRKIYTVVPVRPYSNHSDTTGFKVEKTQNSKMINGYKCYQWLVISKTDNTRMTYWVAKDDFHFFDDILKILNQTDEKNSMYYLKITDSEGFLPLCSVDYSWTREIRSKVLVDVKKKTLKESLFSVPSDYMLFSSNDASRY